jgi:hypothetical protein
VASRKLSLPLFSAKTLVSQPGCSTHYFHFIATVSQKTEQYALVWEPTPYDFSEPRSPRPLPRMQCPNPLQGECEC